MITYKNGNLLADDAEILVNTVNTVGVMGKGIALAFKKAFPYNYELYAHACKIGTMAIGSMLLVEDVNLIYGRKLILNFPTKTHWRKPSEYDYIRRGLKGMVDLLGMMPEKTIAIPALGCGNGGLDWVAVRQMIADSLSELDMDIRVYEPS